MLFALRYIRYCIFIASLLWAIGVFVFIWSATHFASLRFEDLSIWYALTAIAFLYFSLLVSPLTQALPTLPWRAVYVRARRATGVSAFFFALLHGLISFFQLLGGFAGLALLDAKSFFAVVASFIALMILAVLAATSLDTMVRLLGPRWKTLHRFVYLAGVFILIHAVILGTYLSNFGNVIARIFYGAVIFLLVLEALRLYRFLFRRFLTRR